MRGYNDRLWYDQLIAASSENHPQIDKLPYSQLPSSYSEKGAGNGEGTDATVSNCTRHHKSFSPLLSALYVWTKPLELTITTVFYSFF